MKTKITLLVLTALLGLTTVFANSMPTSENVVENEMMTSDGNSIIISAGKRIYSLDMNTYHATLLATSPYVNEINSIASDNATGWLFYVSNHISRYNWTIYGYNVYTNTHKNFGSVRHFFTGTGHARSSRGLASGGATFYNGKLYFAMEYPIRCYYYRDGRRTSSNSNANPKDELDDNPRAAGTVSAGMFTNSTNTRGNAISMEADTTADNGGRDGNGETVDDFEEIEAEEANQLNDNVVDYISEEELPAETADNSDSNLQQRGNSYSTETSYYHGSYNNNIYLLEISFSGLADSSGQTTSVLNGRPVYDNWWYSSFLYRGELGDIVVDDNGQMYAATSYQVQAYNFNSNRYDWANNENIYAQMAKDKHSHLQLLKNRKYYTTYYYHGCPQNVYTAKSFVQKYTAPSHLRTFNSIQLGSLMEISGLDPHDVGRITDASDYINLTPPVSYKIEGFVFDDNNENGSFDSGQGETKLPSVEVTLYADTNADGALDAGDTVIETLNTDASGNYKFENVDVAETLVKVTVPADDTDFTYNLTTAEVVSVTGGTADITGIKFGINKEEVVINVNYDVFGTVYDDDNEDAIFDNGEAGLDNVTLTLYADTNADGVLDAGDTVIATTTSANDGSYSFLHVCIQNTLVAVTVPTDTGDFTYTLTTPGTQAIDSINTNVTGLDFGINEVRVIDYNILGTVFDDDNANGTSETGEAGLEAVAVTLYADNNADGTLNAGDTVISTVNSLADGSYSFSNVIVGNVVVAVTVPTDTPDFTYTLTTAGELAGSSTTTDLTGFDFGIDKVKVIDYTISGNVYDDNDESGAQDAGEDNLELITVTLYADNNIDGAVDAGDAVIATAISAADGTYSFANVTVENTVVAVTVPGNTPDFTYTLTTPGQIDTSSTIVNVDNVNFGINEVLVIDYAISGTVFDDDNENATQDAGEANLDGITVTLYADNNADGVLDVADTTITTTTTAADGTYSFAGVTVQNTLTIVTVPGNTATFTYTLTTPSQVNTSSTNVNVDNVDFGINEVEVIDYNISGVVFDDDNEDGNNDASEGRIPNVVVRLYEDVNEDGALDANDVQLANRATGSSGEYQFENVAKKKTLVEFTIPANSPNFTYTATTPDVVAVTGTINDVTDVDYGVNQRQVIDYNISGTVFDDDNENGTQDAGERDLDNITVTLYADNNDDGVVDAGDTVISTATTANDGVYNFTGVTTENTIVEVTVPGDTANFTYTLTTAGAVDTSSLITDVVADFGINQVEIILYDISGTVFDDDDANGVRDTGEGFVQGVVVTLYADNDGDGILGGTDTVIGSTTSSTAAGDYTFAGVTVRNTIVEVTVPANQPSLTYTLTTAATQAVSSAITDVTGVDFGIDEFLIVNYNIFGTVYDDDNENAVLDTTETGRLANVTLTLYVDDDADGRVGSGDTVIATTTSAADGTYSFLNVTIQNTLVSVTIPANDVNFNYTLTTDARIDTSSVSTDVTDVDFGINQVSTTYTVSGNVFNDVNADGVNEAAEAGLNGVVINLFDDVNGNGRVDRGEPLIATTSSDRSGNYQFGGITAPNVILQMVLPTNTPQFTYIATTPVSVVLTGGVSTTVDFGINRQLVVLYNVSGVIWDDQNADQIKDANEPRLSGIGVTLFHDVNANGALDTSDISLSTVVTGTNGGYIFTGINLRNVLVVPTAPADGTFTTPNTRAVSSISTDAIDVDFGISIASSLFQVTGVVFDDQNENGILDAGENSIDGLPVEIYADTDNSGTLDTNIDLLVAFTQTSNNGFLIEDPNYVVDSVPGGQVLIRIVVPEDTLLVTYTITFDPDSGTAAPDGVFATFMSGNLSNINFGLKIEDTSSTSRAANDADVMFTQDGAPEDVSDRLRLYPNPTVQQIAINAEEFAGDVTVEIYNDRGYRVLTTTVSPFGNEVKVDVQRLAPGMYYAKFGSRNKVASKKFIKK
ncbi:serine-aspartate repeat-containing protein D [Kordia sp. SMS9]|uniref:beta strand repeat-containing protein n=1 Tax=Kordia sp. SMS9 TaxID=2282170 RepID=UPI000E0D6B84|nr:SdrD B-like domain-containing protein [Kordia sp. SMS9]AXG68994.1 serine-aspartate repeat-containing protein D [Kordia sp. SMS9]